ncbi:hypothetical protein NDU88_008902 [Pleurodeles waltl]|uniref:4Fe-4S Mo/W bis-MGD-type domain-containing protein n=1 Tax=Pleurodeles waltl TaxID=8319 RepID=A0AAV7NXY6_PLEWA|nr:hypothetical protein NDU88_008902 [Pleurodeles waltl]
MGAVKLRISVLLYIEYTRLSENHPVSKDRSTRMPVCVFCAQFCGVALSMPGGTAVPDATSEKRGEPLVVTGRNVHRAPGVG